MRCTRSTSIGYIFALFFIPFASVFALIGTARAVEIPPTYRVTYPNIKDAEVIETLQFMEDLRACRVDDSKIQKGMGSHQRENYQKVCEGGAGGFSLQRIRMVWAYAYDVWSDHQRFPELVTSMDSFELDPWRHWYWLSVIGLVFWYKKRQPPSSSPTTRVILIRRVFTLAVGVTVFLVVLTATNLWSIGLELALSEFSFRPSAK